MIKSTAQRTELTVLGAVGMQQRNTETARPVEAEPAVAEIEHQHEAQQVAVEALADIKIADNECEVIDPAGLWRRRS